MHLLRATEQLAEALPRTGFSILTPKTLVSLKNVAYRGKKKKKITNFHKITIVVLILNPSLFQYVPLKFYCKIDDPY